MNTAKLLAAIASLSVLAGCISFGEDPPPSLLTLTATASPTVGTSVSAGEQGAIMLTPFEAPQRIDVTRVPVQINDSEVAYLKEAVWVEKPQRLFRRLIAETLRAETGRVVIDGDDPGVLGDERLSGVLREFGYDARTSEVVVVLDATRSNGDAAATTRRFEARVPGVLAETGPVGVALNQAANDVAGQVADWVAGGA